jgi:hypothetical protein
VSKANVAKYQSFQVDPTKATSALTCLCNEALKNNRNVVSQFVRNEPLIFDKHNSVYFSQYLEYCRKYDNKQEMLNIAGKFIRSTVGYVINSSNLLYTLPRIITTDKLFTSLLKDSGI